MLLAVKGNREVKIDGNEEKAYIEADYKILKLNKDGVLKVIHDPAKAVDANTKLADENKKLKAEVKKLEKEVADKDANIKEIQAELKKVTNK